MNNSDKKRESEKLIVKEMIEIYCKKKHKTKTLCPFCNDLLNYSLLKIDNCPVIETKTFCSKCSIHCYNKNRSTQIKQVMRFSGPRIFFKHPFLVIKHFLL
jgi:hypothetical protein